MLSPGKHISSLPLAKLFPLSKGFAQAFLGNISCQTLKEFWLYLGSFIQRIWYSMLKKEILRQIQMFVHREIMRCWKWQNLLQLCSDYLKTNKETDRAHYYLFYFFCLFSLILGHEVFQNPVHTSIFQDSSSGAVCGFAAGLFPLLGTRNCLSSSNCALCCNEVSFRDCRILQ